MATKRRVRSMTKSALSPSLRHYLESGDYKLRDLFPDDPRGRVEVFRLAYPSKRMRAELQKVWEVHRGEVLRQWKAERRRGLPWAETVFNERKEVM